MWPIVFLCVLVPLWLFFPVHPDSVKAKISQARFDVKHIDFVSGIN